MGICIDTFKTLGLTTENQAKRARSRSGSLPSIFRTSSREARSSSDDSFGFEKGSCKKHKLVKLKNLKNGGTTIKNDQGEFEYHYDPLEIANNPYTTKCTSSDKGYSVELKMDTPPDKVVVLPDLPTQYSEVVSTRNSSMSSTHLFESSSTSSIPNVGVALQAITNGGVTVSGTVVIKLKESQIPQRLRHQSIALKCFVEEFSCFVDSSKSKLNVQKEIKAVNKKDEKDFTHLRPFKELKFDMTDMVDPGSADNNNRWLQSGHTYELPFIFTLKPYELPASVRTYFGSTHYRIESLTQIGNQGIDTSFLTDQILLKRVLPTTSNIKYESVQMNGSWNEDLNYNVFLSSKMIELGNPFEVQIGLLKQLGSKIKLETISILLSQTVAIPCVSNRTGNLLPTSYLKKNDFEIYRKNLRDASNPENAAPVQNNFGFNGGSNSSSRTSRHRRNCSSQLSSKPADTDDDVLQMHYLHDLVVNEDSAPWIRPFYCEVSTECPGRARLKITHTLNIRLKVSNTASCRSDAAPPPDTTYLTFKIPILLVDHDMTTNLWLPPYGEPSTNNGVSFCASELIEPSPPPPEYSSLIPYSIPKIGPMIKKMYRC